MQENVLEALTVVDVMREMGVSIRTLQLAFQEPVTAHQWPFCGARAWLGLERPCCVATHQPL